MKKTEIINIVNNNKEKCINFLQKIIKIPSENGNEYDVSKFIQKELKQLNLKVKTYEKEKDRPNIIAEWTNDPSKKTFMFNGHIDVFPANEEPGIFEPFSGKIKDNRIYGRGAADMKGGVAAAIMAIKLLKENNFLLNGNITLALDVDEENGGKAGVEYLLEKNLLKADFGICMEASQGNIIADSDGRISFKISYKGDSWFAGTRKDEKNAIAKMYKALSKIYEYDAYLKKERYFGLQNGGAILSVTEIQASEGAVNINPGVCTITLDRRYTKGETVESATKELKHILDDLYKNDPTMEYELEVPDASKQIIVDHNCLLVKTIQNVYNNYYGTIPPFLRRCGGGGGDACKIIDQYHYPLPQFGPGEFNQLSISDESLDINEFLDYIKMYMLIVLELLA